MNNDYTDEEILTIINTLKIQLINPSYENWKWDKEFKIMLEFSNKNEKKYNDIKVLCKTLLDNYFKKFI